MEMLDLEETSTQSGHAEHPLREYGDLVGKIHQCFDDICTLKHEIEKVEDRQHMEKLKLFPDKETLNAYDGTIKMLTEAQSYIKRELSVYEKRALDLRPDVYCAKNRYLRVLKNRLRIILNPSKTLLRALKIIPTGVYQSPQLSDQSQVTTRSPESRDKCQRPLLHRDGLF